MQMFICKNPSHFEAFHNARYLLTVWLFIPKCFKIILITCLLVTGLLYKSSSNITRKVMLVTKIYIDVLLVIVRVFFKKRNSENSKFFFDSTTYIFSNMYKRAKFQYIKEDNKFRKFVAGASFDFLFLYFGLWPHDFNFSLLALFNIFLESSHRCIYAILKTGVSSSASLTWNIGYDRAELLPRITFFVLFWFICLSFSLIHFK